MTFDPTAIQRRYQAALDAKPGKGPIDPAPLWDSVCDIPELLTEIDRLTQDRPDLPQNRPENATGGEKATRVGSDGEGGLKSAHSASADGRLDEIRAREQAATEGPWRVWRDPRTSKSRRNVAVETAWCHGDIDGDTELITDYLPTVADAEFIAHAREDIPWLLDLARRQATALAAVGAAHRPTSGDLEPPDYWCQCGKPYLDCPTVRAITEAVEQ